VSRKTAGANGTDAGGAPAVVDGDSMGSGIGFINFLNVFEAKVNGLPGHRKIGALSLTICGPFAFDWVT
jgi:hypothetical protein